MDGDVSVARGDEGSEGGEEPEATLDAGLEEDVGLGLIDDVEVVADDERGAGGDDYAADIDFPEDAVEAQIALAKSCGELERADEQGDDAAECVGKKDEFFAEDAGAVGVGVAEVGVLDEGQDDEGGDAHEGPEGGLGVGARARERS